MSDKKKFKIKKERKKFNISSDKKDKFKISNSEDKEETNYKYRKGLFNLDNLVKLLNNRKDVNAAVKSVNTVYKMNRNGIIQQNSSIVMFSGSSQYYEVIKRGRVNVPTLELDCIIGEYGNVLFLVDMTLETEEAQKLIEELVIEQDPAGAVVREMRNWLTEILNEGRVDYLSDFRRYRTRLQRALAEKASSIGLKANITNLQLKDTSIADNVYNIENDFTRVQLRNLNDFVEVKYRASMKPNKAQRVYAIRNKDKKDQIPSKVTNYLKTILRRYDFGELYEQELSELVDDFKEEINTMMEDERLGWQLDDFVIEFKDSDIEVPEYYLLENEKVTVHIRGEKKSLPITVYNTLALNLNEDGAKKAKSNRKKIKNIDTWLKGLMSKVIHNCLMGVSYADLLINRFEYETLIRNRLLQETERVGYSISNFMTIPEVEDGKLGNLFNFETDKDIEYHTNIGDIVKLQIIVQKVKIDDLENIRPYLQHDYNIKKEMIRLVEQTVSNFLHDKNPDDYYIHFDQTMKLPLQEVIREALVEEFHVNRNVKIIPKRIKTPLIERLDALKGLHSFDFESFGQLKYTIHFKVNGIDPNGWVNFKELPFGSNEEQIDALKHHLKGFLEEVINSNFTIALKSVKHPKYLEVMKRFFNAGVEHIKNKFGLIIELTLVKRHRTSAEELYEKDQMANLEIKQTLIEERKRLAIKIAKNKTNKYDELMIELKTAKKMDEPDEVRRIEAKLLELEKDTHTFDSLEDEIGELESEVDDTLDRLLGNNDLMLLN